MEYMLLPWDWNYVDNAGYTRRTARIVQSNTLFYQLHFATHQRSSIQRIRRNCNTYSAFRDYGNTRSVHYSLAKTPLSDSLDRQQNLVAIFYLHILFLDAVYCSSKIIQALDFSIEQPLTIDSLLR